MFTLFQFLQGFLLLGADASATVPFILLVILSILGNSSILLLLFFVVPAFFAVLGIPAVLMLVRSEAAQQYLGHASVARRNDAESITLFPSL